MSLASLTMSHCSALRVKAAVPFYVPCRVVATLRYSALRVKAAIHFCVPRLLATSHCVGSRRSILCASLPDDVTLLGSVCEYCVPRLLETPHSSTPCVNATVQAYLLHGIRLPLATLIRKRFYIKRHLAVSPT